MIKIAICDDEKVCINNIEKLLIDYANEKNLIIEIDVFLEGQDLVNSNLENYDIIFLDVEMGHENGIEVAKQIRLKNKDVFLVYVSGLIHYAPAGYEVRARAYILKTDLNLFFNSTMDSLLKEMDFQDDTYNFKINEVLIKLPLKNILFIESFNKVIIIHTINHEKDSYEVRAKIGSLEKELSGKGFLQIHKSYLVNMENLNKMKNYKAYLVNGDELNVSQRKWQDIYSKYVDWRGRM